METLQRSERTAAAGNMPATALVTVRFGPYRSGSGVVQHRVSRLQGLRDCDVNLPLNILGTPTNRYPLLMSSVMLTSQRGYRLLSGTYTTNTSDRCWWQTCEFSLCVLFITQSHFAVLVSAGHKIVLEETLDRDMVELIVNGETVFQCNIRELDFGGDGKLDPLCEEASQAVLKAY